MERAMCEVWLKDRKRTKDLILMLGLNETIEQQATANSACWYGDVLRKEDGLVLNRALDLLVKNKRKKLGQRGLGKGRLRKKV